MKNLDLNTFGVQEMTANEINATNGGSILGVVLWAAACFAWDSISNPKATAEAMIEGFDSGYNSINF